MPSKWQRSTSTVMASIDFSQRTSSGLPRLMRYDVWATGRTIPVCSSALRNAAVCSADNAGAFHWLLFLVKSCTVAKWTAWAAQTARSQPPAIDMWAPNFRELDLRFLGACAAETIG